MVTRRTTPKPRSTAMGSRTKPKLGYCQGCFAPIFACTYDALSMKLDPYPLTPKGELMAWVSGCKTYFLCNGTVWRRTPFAIKSSPTGLGGNILRTHLCGNYLPTGDNVQSMTKRDEKDPGF